MLASRFAGDPDEGPFTAWWWAYKTSTEAFTYAEPEFEGHQKTGFVFFDWARVQRRNILTTSSAPRDDLYTKDDAEILKRKMEKTNPSQKIAASRRWRPGLLERRRRIEAHLWRQQTRRSGDT